MQIDYRIIHEIVKARRDSFMFISAIRENRHLNSYCGGENGFFNNKYSYYHETQQMG